MNDAPIFAMTRQTRGSLLFVSGQTPMLADATVPEGFEAQTRAVVSKIAGLLEESGSGWDQVIKLGYYLTDVREVGALRKVLGEVLPERRPAATLVEVSALVDSRFLVEIDAIAEIATG